MIIVICQQLLIIKCKMNEYVAHKMYENIQ